MANSEIYCKYCGLELEEGKCDCEGFLNSKKTGVKRGFTLCDTCGKKIDKDVLFCPYCGMPLGIGEQKEELQRRLEGEFEEDVIEHYEGKKKTIIERVKSNFTPATWTLTMLLSVLLICILIGKILYPFLKLQIDNYKMKQVLSSSVDETIEKEIEQTIVNETEIVKKEVEPVLIDLRDKWIKQDGFVYCFDKNGDAVVDEWVTETDENGNEKKYYFDIDGRLVVNSWIDGEYYVGADGAMLTDTDTPDGAHVDIDGMVVVNPEDGINPLTSETKIYYESPDNTSETKVASTVNSSTAGVIKGIDNTKTYELYVKELVQIRDTVVRGDLKCNIIIYMPIMAGTNEKEVRNINERFETMVKGEYLENVKELVNQYSELPKSIVFNEIEQRGLNKNRLTVIMHGRVVPRKDLTTKHKFRFIYDRKSKAMLLRDISNGT